MSPLRPRTQLETHQVVNQPPPFENVNLFTSDRALEAAVIAAGGGGHRLRLSGFGALAGSAEVAEWAEQANRNPPVLHAFDRYGQRLDEVEFHPAYHKLMALGVDAGVAASAWSGAPAGHVLHAALEFLMAEAEPGVCCPMTMSYAAYAVLRRQQNIAPGWTAKLLAARYDPASRPMPEKAGVTIGMAMTEKQGGSDLRANATRAVRNADGTYILTGHKWFCSAPMSDAFLTLAQTDEGLGCFLVPRWTDAGERNAIQLMRLKDKLGDRANASAEIEYHGAVAWPIGEPGHGVRAIIEMVHHTRLDCMIAPAAYMRQAVALALWHASHRLAFGKKLVEQALMRRVLADMVLESEAATALAFQVARGFDESPANEAARLFCRLATPIGKYWINRRVVNLVYEAMEVHGGGGYIEESLLPRIFRQSPLNSIWEGSGNVICLDVLRTLARQPQARGALVEELESARGAVALLDGAIDAAKTMLCRPAEEADARRLVGRLGLVLQGVALVRTAPAFVGESFCLARLGERSGFAYGALDGVIAEDALLERAMPVMD